MKISIIWTGYVWLIQAVWLSKLWFEVTAIDIFEEKIDKLKKAIATIYEKGLDELLKETYKNIDFSINLEKVTWSDAIFICVGTPQNKDWETDLWYIEQVINNLKKILNWDEIIIIKSTVPVWTNKKMHDLLERKNSIVSNPEFLREWFAIEDFFNPDRIVLGFDKDEKKETKEKVISIYKTFKEKNIEIIKTNWESSELIKYSANSFLACKISFINEISKLADKTWANIKDISKAIWLDPRIWEKFLNAWIWYWWSCFPKDVKSLIHQFKENDLKWEIIKEVDKVNQNQVQYFFDKILNHYDNKLHWKSIWFLWVAFKPWTDDLRESKAIELIEKLIYSWAKLKIYDYNKQALDNFKKYINWLLLTNSRWFFDIEIKNNFEEINKNSDSLIIAIEDKEILKEDFSKIKLKDNIIFDGKNLLKKDNIKKLWFKYIAVGQ